MASDLLGTEEKRAAQLVSGKTGYTIGRSDADLENFRNIAGNCSYIGREGVEFYPQELVVFEYDSPGPKAGTVFMKNLQVPRSKYKIPQQKVLLETRYLFPLVKGPSIRRLHHEDANLYVAFPYDAADPHAPIPITELRKRSPHLLRYFEKYKIKFEQQNKYSDNIRGDGEYYGLARTGPYSFQSCYVAYRDNSKWHATVITSKKCSWGETKRFLFQNHAVSICERIDGGIIGEDEAFFVSGIFNAPIVEAFIYASSDNRSFKIRPPVFVPLYDRHNTTHKRIVELARQAASQGEQLMGSSLNQIEKLYLELCNQRKENKPNKMQSSGF